MPRLHTASLLLAGAAFAFMMTPADAAEKGSKPAPHSGDAEADGEIIVTGSHIRGAVSASDVLKINSEEIIAAGQTDLGEAIRSLPQNFAGGQNPGVGTGAGLTNSNVNSASSVNLRGLGADASLTLLNGHRLPYDSAFGGVDISAIPLAALDRIEVLPDGASALYGSDAVAGVVNVLLRRDYEGITTSGQLRASTDGGNFQQQADVVAGSKWAGGGFIVAYDYSRNTGITAAQRPYASTLDPETSLYPSQRRHAAVLSAHQDLGSGIRASVDILYSHRDSDTVGGTAAARYRFRPEVESLTLAPSFEFALGNDWTVKAQGVLGRDRTHYNTTFTSAGGSAVVTSGCFCNRAASAELGAEGPLFALAGGDARIAFGTGYRSNGMDYSRFVGTAANGAFNVSRSSRFAYGEINLPFVAPENDLRGIARLSLSAALRYEDYPGMARLATPRIGLVYAPIPELTLRGTWSRSFKAPTLYQQYVGYQTYLLPAIAFGVTDPGRTVLYASGGNPDLKPERARSWTAGFELRPLGSPALTLGATWFDIRYKDRVVQPIAGSIAAAFRDPGYATLIDFSPSASDLAGLISGAELGLQNFSGSAYDAALVAALVDNRNVNVALQSVHGIDARLGWSNDLDAGRRLNIDIAGTWLSSSQQLTAALPEVKLAGTVFNPPSLRLRGAIAYQDRRLRLGTTLNYTGALTDRRFATPARLSPQATVDLAVRYDFIPREDGEPGLAVSLNASNVFNARPRLIRTTGPTDTPYDSTNYSPIGRFIALGVTRRW